MQNAKGGRHKNKRVYKYHTCDINSFMDKANYYGIHVVHHKKCCALQENVVNKQLILYDQETSDQYVVDYKV